MKERNIGIDILKCFAALLITNSHMEILYIDYKVLATGGDWRCVIFLLQRIYTVLRKNGEIRQLV